MLGFPATERRAGSAPDELDRRVPEADRDDSTQRRVTETDEDGEGADPDVTSTARAVAPPVAGALTLVAALAASPFGADLPHRAAAALIALVAAAIGIVDPWRRVRSGDLRRWEHLLPLTVGVVLSAVPVALPSVAESRGGWTSPASVVRLLAALALLTGLCRLAARRLPGRGLELFADGMLPAVVLATVFWPLLPHGAASGVILVDAALGLACALVAGRLADRYAAASPGEMILAVGAGLLFVGRGLAAAIDLSDMGAPSYLSDMALVAGLGCVTLACTLPALRRDRSAQRTETTAVGLGHFGAILVAVVTVPPIVTIEVFQNTSTGIVGSALAAAGPSLAVVGYLVWQVRDRSRGQLDALHDPLTGLATRTLFDDRLSTALLTAERRGGSFAVVALDLNRFKQINDTHGHGAGDKVLQEVAARLRASVRAVDSVARFGGDEFMVLLPQLTSPDEWQPVVQRILDAVMQPIDIGPAEVVPGSSAGVAVYPEDGTTAISLIGNADAALYRSKVLGGRRFVRYDQDFGAEIRYRTQLENGLHRALERGELELHYQPVIDAGSGHIVATEALLRWRHPVFGVVSPERFVSLAEHTGLIGEIGEWVLDEACRQTTRWHDLGHKLRIAVNLSARQFDRTSIDSMVARILRRSGLEARFLELELTESQAVDHPEQTIATLNALRDMGVRCAIDDFGTGYSGLSALLRLPIDTLKIDRSFVSHLTDSDHDQSVVKAIIALAHSMEKTVIAEGVETPEQLRLLRDYSCDHVQGYLFSRPVPTHELTELLSLHDRLTPTPAHVPAGAAGDPGEAARPVGSRLPRRDELMELARRMS
jgi:diguanylate cyclase (GGDEF)-like protein